MAQETREPQTFVEMVLALLEDRFPWLGHEEQEAVSGANTVQELSDLHERLVKKRTDAQNCASRRT
jgi:hypothetical protein